MAHLLMIESWVGASGNLLPPLLKEMGHTYTFVTRKLEHYQQAHSTEQHPVIYHAFDVLVTETNDSAGLIEFLRPYQFDGVITVCDYYIETVQEVAKAFQLPCPFPADVRTVRQKHLMRQAIDRARLDNAKYVLASSWSEVEAAARKLGYPIVMKPVDLASSAFVSLIKQDTELKEAYDALKAFPLNFRDQPRDGTYLIEAYMEGVEVSVESISYNGETTILGVTDKTVTGSPYFIENGHMFPAALDENTYRSLTEYVQKVLKAVGFDHGIAHTEVKLTSEGPRIVEINPRTAGNYIVELITRVTGINMLQSFVELSLGLKPSIMPKQTGVASAAVMFLVPPKGGTIVSIQGIESLEKDEHVVLHKIQNCEGTSVSTPIDNACYLGHIMTVDRNGLQARGYAEQALERIVLNFQGEDDDKL